MNSQTFSCGFNSGHLAGSAMGDEGTVSRGDVPPGLVQQEHGMPPRRDPGGQLKRFIAAMLHQGRIKPAALPSLGQAPKMQVPRGASPDGPTAG